MFLICHLTEVAVQSCPYSDFSFIRYHWLCFSLCRLVLFNVSVFQVCHYIRIVPFQVSFSDMSFLQTSLIQSCYSADFHVVVSDSFRLAFAQSCCSSCHFPGPYLFLRSELSFSICFSYLPIFQMSLWQVSYFSDSRSADLLPFFILSSCRPPHTSSDQHLIRFGSSEAW